MPPSADVIKEVIMRNPPLQTIAAVSPGYPQRWTPKLSGAGQLNAPDHIYISVLGDGTHGVNIPSGSGRNTAQIIFSPLIKYAAAVRSDRDALDFGDAPIPCKRGRQEHLFLLGIMSWEAPVLEMSEMSDRVLANTWVAQALSSETIKPCAAKRKSALASLDIIHKISPKYQLPRLSPRYLTSEIDKGRRRLNPRQFAKTVSY